MSGELTRPSDVGIDPTVQKSIWGFVLGVCVGGLVGWRSLTGGSHSQATNEKIQRAVHVSGDRDDRPVWTESDFTADALRNRDLYYGSKERGIEKWSDAELRAALDASLREPECMATSGSSGGIQAAAILLGEWMKRDLDGALAWFEQVKPETARDRMAFGLDVMWPEEEAERGLVYFREHPELKGPGSSYVFNNAALLIAKRGPAAFADFLEQASPEERRYLGSTWQESFPPGFDFSSLMETKTMQEMLDARQGYTLLRMWQKQNPDQVMAYLIENDRTNMLLGMVRSDYRNREKAMEWIGSKIDSMDAESRAKVVAQAKQEMSNEPAMLRNIADATRDPALQESLRREGLRLMFYGNTAEGLKFLDKIALPSQRIEMLEALAPIDANTRRGRSIQPPEADVLRQKLREWNADEARIDTIIGGLTKISQPQQVSP